MCLIDDAVGKKCSANGPEPLTFSPNHRTTKGNTLTAVSVFVRVTRVSVIRTGPLKASNTELQNRLSPNSFNRKKTSEVRRASNRGDLVALTANSTILSRPRIKLVQKAK